MQAFSAVLNSDAASTPPADALPRRDRAPVGPGRSGWRRVVARSCVIVGISAAAWFAASLGSTAHADGLDSLAGDVVETAGAVVAPAAPTVQAVADQVVAPVVAVVPAPAVAAVSRPAAAAVTPVAQAAAPVVQAAAPVVQAAAPVVQAAAPIVQAAAPVIQAAAPVVHAAAPVVQAAAPVVQAAAPVVQAAAPVVQAAAPVLQTATPVLQAANPALEALAPVTSVVIPAISPITVVAKPALEPVAEALIPVINPPAAVHLPSPLPVESASPVSTSAPDANLDLGLASMVPADPAIPAGGAVLSPIAAQSFSVASWTSHFEVQRSGTAGSVVAVPACEPAGPSLLARADLAGIRADGSVSAMSTLRAVAPAGPAPTPIPMPVPLMPTQLGGTSSAASSSDRTTTAVGTMDTAFPAHRLRMTSSPTFAIDTVLGSPAEEPGNSPD